MAHSVGADVGDVQVRPVERQPADLAEPRGEGRRRAPRRCVARDGVGVLVGDEQRTVEPVDQVERVREPLGRVHVVEHPRRFSRRAGGEAHHLVAILRAVGDEQERTVAADDERTQFAQRRHQSRIGGVGRAQHHPPGLAFGEGVHVVDPRKRGAPVEADRKRSDPRTHHRLRSSPERRRRVVGPTSIEPVRPSWPTATSGTYAESVSTSPPGGSHRASPSATFTTVRPSEGRAGRG